MPDAHPRANLFPMMTDAEIDDLGGDMVAHGQRKKIMLYEVCVPKTLSGFIE